MSVIRPGVILPLKEEVLARLEESDLLDPSWRELAAQARELERSQHFIADVLECMSDIVVVSDRAGRVESVNRAVLELTGFCPAEVIGRAVTDLFAAPPTNRDGIGRCALLCDCPEKLRKALHDCEARLIGRDGHPSEPVTLSCQARRGGSERVVEGLVIIGRPVGELRRAYEALARAHQERIAAEQKLLHTEKMASLGRLVAGVAHELNNPVSFVFGNMQALERYRGRLERYLASLHAEPVTERAQAARAELGIDRIIKDLPSLIEGSVEGATRIRDIVRDLLTLTFRDNNPPEHIDLHSVVEGAVAWVQREGRWPDGLTVQLEVPPMLTVRGRRGRLHQVLVNLVKNAADAMRGTAWCAFSAGAGVGAGLIVQGQPGCSTGGTPRAVLTLRDHGPGIAESDLPHLFEPFFTTKPVGSGTGLGLWVSYEIIRDHGGEIIASNHPEGGALFTLTLPV